jgi:hypothetical protein
MSMMIGIGTPSSQSSIPRPMNASFFDSGLIVAPSERASVRFVPGNHTSAPDCLRRDQRRRPSTHDERPLSAAPRKAASEEAACLIQK